MRRTALAALFVIAALAPPAWTSGGAAKGAAVKTGGSFDVEEVKGIAYHDGADADPVRHKLDLYLPKGHKDFPVLFFVHGGMWRSGNKELYAPLGKLFAKNGVGTVIINYRLSPKVKHPAHVEDVARAFAWAHKNVAKHGGQPDQIFACGHSAGGHLVALLAVDSSHLAAHKLDCKAIKGVIPMSGVYEISPIVLFEPAFGKDAKMCKAASPLTHVTGPHPPALVVYADKDYPMLDVMAETFGKKLKGCECDVAVLKVANRTHISIIMGLADESDPATQAILEFVARHSGLKLRPREPKDGGAP